MMMMTRLDVCFDVLTSSVTLFLPLDGQAKV